MQHSHWNPLGFAVPAAAASEAFPDQYHIGSQHPGFADAIATEKYHKDHKNLKVSTIMLVIGCLMLFLTVLMPIWESSRLMNDPTFVYFIGREYCRMIMLLCAFAIFLYAAMILLLFGFAREEGRTQQNVMGTATTVITVLGLALLLVAQPLKSESRSAYEELFFRAGTGPRTQRLMEYSAALSALRNQSACASQISVEQCAGYQESQPYTGYLKAIEGAYKCAGFGWDGHGAVPAATLASLAAAAAEAGSGASDDGSVAAEDQSATEAASPDSLANGDVVAGADADASEIGLLSASSSKSGKTLSGALQKLADKQASANPPAKVRAGPRAGDAFGTGLLQTSQAVQRAKQPPAGVSLGEYPPTLFTDANYQTSCDGMAARVLRYEAMEAADMFYHEGVALVFCAIATMMLQVVSMCMDSSSMGPAHGKSIRFAPASHAVPQ